MSVEQQVKEMDVKTRNFGAAVDTHRVRQNKVGHSENSLPDNQALKLLSSSESGRMSGWYQYILCSSLEDVFLN